MFEPRSVRRHDVAVAGRFEDLLLGARLAMPARRGKFLWLPVEPGGNLTASRALVVHLGMSGQLLLREAGAPAGDRLRVRLSVQHPEHGELDVHFVDQRIFGSMSVDSLVPTDDGLPAGLGSGEPLIPALASHIARDPLDPFFEEGRFLDLLARRRSGIKRALLDQELVSGVGNIYADEALWAARLHYATESCALPRARSRELLEAVRLVFAKALAEGGTSFDAQYVNVNGASGYFAHSLNVYGQQGRPCPRCGSAIIRERFMNRSSHLCPKCQRLRYRRRSIG